MYTNSVQPIQKIDVRGCLQWNDCFGGKWLGIYPTGMLQLMESCSYWWPFGDHNPLQGGNIMGPPVCSKILWLPGHRRLTKLSTNREPNDFFQNNPFSTPLVLRCAVAMYILTVANPSRATNGLVSNISFQLGGWSQLPKKTKSCSQNLHELISLKISWKKNHWPSQTLLQRL